MSERAVSWCASPAIPRFVFACPAALAKAPGMIRAASTVALGGRRSQPCKALAREAMTSGAPSGADVRAKGRSADTGRLAVAATRLVSASPGKCAGGRGLVIVLMVCVSFIGSACSALMQLQVAQGGGVVVSASG
jgi:hypothetical protein